MRSESNATRVAHVFFHRIVRPTIEFLTAFGTTCAFYLGTVGKLHATMPVFAAGYSPASALMADLPQSTVIYYDKTFIENLKANTAWVKASNRRTLEQNSGNQLRLYMYQRFGPNIVQAAEGTVGTGLPVAVLQNTSTIGQYADYVNVSDIAMQTAIDPALENIAKEIAYRAAISVNLIIQNTVDAASAIDPLVNMALPATQPMETINITGAVQSLLGQDVMPFNDTGTMTGIMHPFVAGDLLSDRQNNSLVDALKRSPEGQELLRELPQNDAGEMPIIDWGGARFHQSTLVHTIPNFDGSTSTALRTYVVGQNGIITISLGAKDNTVIGDGDWRNLQVWIKRATEPTVSDASRMIGGWTSYNLKMTATLPPDTTMRVRFIDSVPVTT